MTTTKSRPKATAKAKPTRSIVLTIDPDTRRALRVAILAASKDPFRPILCGVHIVDDGKAMVIEATDSYRLHRVHMPTTGRTFDANVPAAWLARWVNRRKAELTLTIRGDTATMSDALDQSGETSTVTLIGGDFPRTAQLVSPEGDPLTDKFTVNARYWGDIVKAAELMHGFYGATTITQRTDRPMDPIVVRTVGPYSAELLLMPVRVP